MVSESNTNMMHLRISNVSFLNVKYASNALQQHQTHYNNNMSNSEVIVSTITLLMYSSTSTITLLFGSMCSSTSTITQKVRLLRVRIHSKITPYLIYICT